MNNQFTTYKIQLQILSSVATPFQADTLFGTLCWGIALLEGNDKLRDFLELYKKKETIPLIISDGFFDGYLPKPALKPLTLKDSEELVKSLVAEDNPQKKVEYINRIKDFKKTTYLSVKHFARNKGIFSQRKLLDDYLNNKIETLHQLTEDAYILRTSIDRYSGKAMEGRLFHTEETFYNAKINIYVKLRNECAHDAAWLKTIFSYVSLSGYGADKSTGRGQVKIESIEEKDDLPHADDPNAFISLSSFVPDEDDPSEGWYLPLLKYGKLGEHYANSSIDKIVPETNEKIGNNPFKRPLLMFRAGSTFKIKEDEELKPYYGRIVENIHWDKDIVHYGFVFPLGIRLEENNFIL